MPPRNSPDTFWSRVSKDADGCWRYPTTRRDGYAVVKIAGWFQKAHRVAYELTVGPVPDGRELDHLCRNRNCVNPVHLEPVAHAENVRRAFATQTGCRKGHPYTETNLIVDNTSGARRCRICRNATSKAWKRLNRVRIGIQRGERHHEAKLTEQQVRAIRAATGTLPEIAAQFGVTPGNIWAIRKGKSWSWLT